MLKKKKAQGMSIKIIIVAVIGLIILVIVIALLTSRFNIFGEGVGTTLTENVPGLDKDMPPPPPK